MLNIFSTSHGKVNQLPSTVQNQELSKINQSV